MEEYSNELLIESAAPEDAEELLHIYSHYVSSTAITFEYEVPSLEDFRGRIENTLKSYPYIVARKAGRILGYAYASAFRPRPAYQWSTELSVYVDKEARRSGVGGLLSREIENQLRERGFLNINSCIAATPEDRENDEYLDNNSMEFHKHMGYRLVGRFHRCGYKFDRWYDMVWMEKSLGEHTVPPRPIIRP